MRLVKFDFVCWVPAPKEESDRKPIYVNPGRVVALFVGTPTRGEGKATTLISMNQSEEGSSVDLRVEGDIENIACEIDAGLLDDA